MALTRADYLSGTNKQKDFFSDFVTSFAKTPYGNQLGKVTNSDSVDQSLRNLVKTNLGERLFQPLIGSDVYSLLFEHNSVQNTDMVELYIENMIRNSEPRVNLIRTEVSSEITDENEVQITIVYNLINNPDPIDLNILLKRVR